VANLRFIKGRSLKLFHFRELHAIYRIRFEELPPKRRFERDVYQAGDMPNRFR